MFSPWLHSLKQQIDFNHFT
uniref:Uncharacterized protein n=1 Tax=Arundo donax TaxID=35708 RepID=A0A0A9C265_ARUDO